MFWVNESNACRKAWEKCSKGLYLVRCKNTMVTKIKAVKIWVERRLGYCTIQQLNKKGINMLLNNNI